LSIVTQRKLWRTPSSGWSYSSPSRRCPGVIAGVLAEDLVGGLFRNVTSVALWLGATALFYLGAEAVVRRLGSARSTRSEPSRLGALLIGVAQAVALLPGVSRSGLTIATGKLHGLTREAAAKFSFVMSGPIVLGAVLKSFLDLRHEPVGSVEWGPLLLGIVVAGVVGVLAVRWLLRYLKTRTLVPFAMYLLGLSILLLVLQL
jgi:undecaprenyl-diphosphatase